MTPNKAIAIVLIIFLLVAAGFVFLYTQKKLNSEINRINSQLLTVQAPLPTDAIERKVQKIVEEAGINQGKNITEEVRQNIINTINSEVVKIEQSKPMAEKDAEDKAEQERRKIINQINAQK